MDYRTDLAIERKEILDEESGAGEIEGVTMEKLDYGNGVVATRIKILNEMGERPMQKPAGSYITIEAKGILEGRDEVKGNVITAVTEELSSMLKFH